MEESPVLIRGIGHLIVTKFPRIPRIQRKQSIHILYQPPLIQDSIGKVPYNSQRTIELDRVLFLQRTSRETSMLFVYLYHLDVWKMMEPAVNYRTLIYTIETYIHRIRINDGVSRVHSSLEELAEGNTEFLWGWR